MHDRGSVAGRPRGNAWRALQVEGVLWDGYVFITGEPDVDAWLVITNQRFAFYRDNDLVLDVPKSWLRPGPILEPDGSVMLMVDSEGTGAPEPLRLVFREGRRAAAHVVSLSGTGARPVRKRLPVYAPAGEPAAPNPPMARSTRPRTIEEAIATSKRWDERPARREPVDAPAQPERAPRPSRPPRRAAASEERIEAAEPSRDHHADEFDSLAVLDVDDFPPLAQPPVRQLAERNGQSQAQDSVFATVIPASAPPINVNPNHQWNLQPLSAMTSRSTRKQRKAWAIRLSGLMLLILAAAAIGSGRLPELPGHQAASHIPGSTIDAANPGAPTPSPTHAALAQVPPTQTPTAAAPTATTNANSGGPSAQMTVPPLETAIAIGVGGLEESATIESTKPPVGAAEAPPTQTPEPPTATATMTATATETATNTPEPPTATATANATATDTATATPPPTETPQPTLAPIETTVPAQAPVDTATETFTATATETATSEPTTEPTVAATDTIAAIETATAGVTSSPTESATAAVTATKEATATPKPSFPDQAETVDAKKTPDQAFSAGPMRYTIESALRGPTIGELALGQSTSGDWVALVITVQNWSGAAQPFSIDNFQLFASGVSVTATLYPDPTTPQVASFLGFDPALGSGTSVNLDPGAHLRFALVFQVASDSSILELLNGVERIDLTPAIALHADVTKLGATPQSADLLKATVTKVIDGRTIQVKTNGHTATVQYIGVAAPTGNACYADAATAANQALVAGQTVWLEREHTDALDSGVLVRDVWIQDSTGSMTLVSAALAGQGAAAPDATGPDVRYSGWIAASSAAAVYNQAGLWGQCGGLQTPEATSTPKATATSAPEPTTGPTDTPQSSDGTDLQTGVG